MMLYNYLPVKQILYRDFFLLKRENEMQSAKRHEIINAIIQSF